MLRETKSIAKIRTQKSQKFTGLKFKEAHTSNIQMRTKYREKDIEILVSIGMNSKSYDFSFG